MKVYNTRIIKSGNTLEVIEYGKPVFIDNQPDRTLPSGRSKVAHEADKLIHRYRTIKRSASYIRRLIQANSHQYKDKNGRPYKPVFLTLTFKDEISDIKTANHEFKLFNLRLGNQIGGRTNRNISKYLVVPEIQEKRAKKYNVEVWHYHQILFNMPFTPWKIIRKAWGQGDIKLNAIDNIEGIGSYVIKISNYMQKDLAADKLQGEKSFFRSRGLYLPVIEEYNTSCPAQKKMLESVLQTAQASSKKEPYRVEYPSEYYDTIKYTSYTV